jgi:hypothetical protein
VSWARRAFHYGTVRPGLAEAGVQAWGRHPLVHGRDGARVHRLANWLFSHQTAEKVLFGLIAVTVFIAIATGVNPYVGVAGVAIAVVVFFWRRRQQGGVVVGGNHGDDKRAREPAAPSEVAAPDQLPEFAKKADDLDAIKKAVDDAASVSGGLWLSYLFVLFYLAVAAGAVTHADLFFEKAVKLPFLGIDLPLVAFFFVAPLLFVIVHAYTLVHLVMLTDKAKRYHQALFRFEVVGLFGKIRQFVWRSDRGRGVGLSRTFASLQRRGAGGILGWRRNRGRRRLRLLIHDVRLPAFRRPDLESGSRRIDQVQGT